MGCQTVSLPDGVTAIVCDRSRRKVERCACGSKATLLCDWRVPTKKSGTCDAPICAACALQPARGKDLCSKHAQSFVQWQRERAREAR